MLFTAARLIDEEGQRRVNKAAGARRLRPAVARILPHLDVDGVRPTELARRVDVSKQAMQQLLAALARDGVVETVADPKDRRAKLVRLTTSGVAAVLHGVKVLEGIERELADEIGDSSMRALRVALGDLLPVLMQRRPVAARR